MNVAMSVPTGSANVDSPVGRKFSEPKVYSPNPASPRQLLPLPSELVTAPGVLLLRLQNFAARGKPLLARPFPAHPSAARTASS
jgi:hypothetical protein